MFIFYVIFKDDIKCRIHLTASIFIYSKFIQNQLLCKFVSSKYSASNMMATRDVWRMVMRLGSMCH